VSERVGTSYTENKKTCQSGSSLRKGSAQRRAPDLSVHCRVDIIARHRLGFPAVVEQVILRTPFA
jgi:hypothetical protein